jgi:hypothetical protein
MDFAFFNDLSQQLHIWLNIIRNIPNVSTFCRKNSLDKPQVPIQLLGRICLRQAAFKDRQTLKL